MTAPIENELLELAEIVLSRAGFATETLTAQGTTSEAGRRVPAGHWVLAQNEFFVLVVAAMGSLEELTGADEAIVSELVGLVTGAGLGAKQWDIYAVFLCVQSAPQDGHTASRLTAMTYNTRFLRRIVHTGVEPTLLAMEDALSPFLALPETQDAGVVEDSLLLLQAELMAQGVSEELAGRVVAAYRESGSLDSV